VPENRKDTREVKYILMMHCPKNGYEAFGSMPLEEAIRANIAFQNERLHHGVFAERYLVLSVGISAVFVPPTSRRFGSRAYEDADGGP
jgi:hypothetical protein